MKVLIVEDDPDGAAVIELILDAAGIESTIARTAEQAMSILEKEAGSFAGAIVDLGLPGMDGFEFLEAAREHQDFARLPLVAATAFHTPELKDRALTRGFDAYFSKPFDPDELVKTLQGLTT